ncbi:MAG TPA: universal stress protein [Bryobacteraceae bacterium]|jgi:nucleotide-binding universal stress UspA family protein
MRQIKHILFPIDFSVRCCNAVPFVEAMARRYSAKVTLLGVVEPFYYAMGDPGVAVVVNSEELLEDLNARLDASFSRVFAGLCVEKVAALGDPAKVIVDFAHANGVDLIMMPTHGYGPFRRLLLGSVTAKVLHDAKCPVWTLAHTEERPTLSQAACHDILCAVDGTPESASLIKWAGEFSKTAGAPLRLVHVVPAAKPHPELPDDTRDSIERLEGSVGLNAPICVPAGNVAEAICQEARRHDANLVVIGRGAIHGSLGRLRTHAHAIIRESPCPVLSV